MISFDVLILWEQFCAYCSVATFQFLLCELPLICSPEKASFAVCCVYGLSTCDVVCCDHVLVLPALVTVVTGVVANENAISGTDKLIQQ